ncbi:hypothetical protein FACS1894151_00100 [Spirochaetia bacterium]|nr:hypothetical protein FACS1894151_00100 [Spirochaetia bacterium]
MQNRKKILVVDDETLNLEFFDVMLSKLGFVVEMAQDGKEALEKVKRFVPDLVMLDNIMPKMSGWELTKILKSDPKFSVIPIIMLSALDDVKDKVEGFELGVVDYITKPFNFSEVLARIRSVLRNHELMGQIAVREARLNLAEELSVDIRNNIGRLVESVDDLDAGIASGGAPEAQAKALKEKTMMVRKQIAGLDARIERTILEWEDLKKKEIDLQLLERTIHAQNDIDQNEIE